MVKRLHLIFDFQFMYYKYKFSIDSGRMKRLTNNKIAKEAGDNIDISYVYYPLMELESIRKRYTNDSTEVTVSVCFDSKSERKKENIDYKSNRQGKLGESDFSYVGTIREICENAGYNVYKEDGKEADDLVTSLVKKYKDRFDYTLVVTNDSDMAINVSDNSGLYRYKSSLKAYQDINMDTFEEILGNETGCRYPYNTVLLYKSTVGDKSDKIKGITRFGNAAYQKLLGYLDSTGIDYKSCVNPEYIRKVLIDSAGYLGREKVEQAIEALELVRVREVDVKEPVKSDSKETRKVAYGFYDMVSLIAD